MYSGIPYLTLVEPSRHTNEKETPEGPSSHLTEYLFSSTEKLSKTRCFFEKSRFLDTPGRPILRLLSDSREEFIPGKPTYCLHFIWIWPRLSARHADMDRTDLVFHHAVFRDPVPIRSSLLDPISLEAELEIKPPCDGRQVFFVKTRVTTDTIGPDEWPGFLRPRALLHEELALRVEEKE